MVKMASNSLVRMEVRELQNASSKVSVLVLDSRRMLSGLCLAYLPPTVGEHFIFANTIGHCEFLSTFSRKRLAISEISY